MSYGPEWILGTGVALVALLCVPWIAPVIALAVVVLVGLAGVLALAAAVAATPYLLFRSIRRR